MRLLIYKKNKKNNYICYMTDALDISGTEMENMEEGKAPQGIKLMIKRPSLTEEIIDKQEVAKQMEFIFGNMANKITNKKINGKKLPLTIDDAIFNVKLNVINSLNMMDFDSVDNITSTGDTHNKVTYKRVESSLNSYTSINGNGRSVSF